MITIEIDNKEYFMPENFDEVTIDQFARIVSVYGGDGNNFIKNCEMTKILSGIDLASLQYEVGVRVFSYLGFLNGISDVINDNPLNESFFIHEGEKYNIPQTIHNVTFDQYWCLDKILETFNGNSILGQAPLIIALFCLKDGEKYNYDKSAIRVNSFKSIPCTVACRIINGFFLQSRISSGIMKLYLMGEQELEEQTKKLETSIKGGNGTRLSSLFGRNLVKLLKRRKQEQ